MDSLELTSAIRYSRASITRILRRFPSDVEDVLQDAAVKAWRGLASFRGDSAFNSWFHRIAIREALMFIRKRTPQGRFKWLEVGEEHAAYVTDRAPGPLEQAVAGELRRVVEEEIAGLKRPSLREEARALLGEDDEDRNTSTRKARRFHLRRVLRERLERRGVHVVAGY